MVEPDKNTIMEWRKGIGFGLAAYCWWGFLPLWVRALSHVGVLEILAHRIVWSFAMIAVIQLIRGRWGAFFRALRDRRTLMLMLASTAVIMVNWLAFLHSVDSNRLLQASLGYYINPLMSVLLGVAFLKETLRPRQKVAVAFAAAGVTLLTIGAGVIPLISISIALSFSLYGLFRKLAPVDPMCGVGFETGMVTPIFLCIMLYNQSHGGTAIVDGPADTRFLLLLGGVMTATPLIFFSNAARRLTLATIGFLQYITPTLQFLTAVLLFGEEFTPIHLASFAIIWTGLTIYSVDLVAKTRSAAPKDP